MIGKSQPLLRQSELNENSTRYEINLAAPPDETLVKYWSAWAGIALAASIFTLVVFLALITSAPRIRRQSFNMYLIYLMIPDFSFSLLCGITCLMNALNGSYWSHSMCNFQQWYCVWGIGSNCWLNAIITRELHKLLRFSHHRKRYTMPPPSTVTLQAIAVYLYCAFLGTWGLYEKSNFPLHALQISGLACIPVEIDKPSSFFFWFLFLPIFSGIPIVYVCYIVWDIWRRKLLPPSGKRRLLALYFGRIVTVFLLLWGPYFLLNYVFATWLPTSVIFAGGLFSHLQGPASASVSLLKPDIWRAVKDFLSCSCRPFGYDDGQEFQKVEREGNDGGSAHVLRRLSTAVRRSTLQFFGSHSENDTADNYSGVYSNIWPEEDGGYEEHDDHELSPVESPLSDKHAEVPASERQVGPGVINDNEDTFSV